ncbi:DUF779 domain-containing protein [Rossellomorea oryzaecorticis]|uniref:DUF779 domain-containing protein n=1 Tax=Rossellomorea oryzaecorticis TaxID=1396505 RepID=A0ABU9KCI1_9BACI
MENRLEATEQALQLIEKLKSKHGPLLFHQSGGCCDGSSPMCLSQDDLIIGDSDVLVGTAADCPFYMNSQQYEYWKNFKIILDVKPGRGGVFSLESTEGMRFITDSELMKS